VDSSALSKRYLDEPGSDDVARLLDTDPDLVTARHTYVEVHRAIGTSVDERERATRFGLFSADWPAFQVVELHAETCERAADYVVTLGVRTLDALHLAAAHRVGGGALPFLTFDLRQAQAARSLGWTVLGT
jgi:hypothetical protein